MAILPSGFTITMNDITQSNTIALCTRAARIQRGPSTQAAYESILDRAANLRMEKVLSYGESRYNDPDVRHSLTILYADCYRKLVRLRAYIIDGQHEGEPLQDTFLDLLNFAAMGLQLYEAGHNAPEIHLLDAQEMQESQGLPFPGEEDRSQSERIDQIAIYSSDPENTRRILGEIFGQELEWSRDTVTAEGRLYEVTDVVNRAELSYNYQLCSVEFEVLQYVMGNSWQSDKSKHTPRVSHFGVHVEDLSEWEVRLRGLGYKVAQQVQTTDHTNPMIRDTRRYAYQIWDTVEALGFYLKLIQRITLPSRAELYED